MKILILISFISVSLTQNSISKKIKSHLEMRGFTKEGAGAIMGNLYAESGLNPKYYDPRNRSTLRMSEDEYVKQANDGSNPGYKKFVLDKVRFGLAGWSRWNRKQSLLNYCQGHVGDPFCQIDYLIKELKEDYKYLYELLFHCKNVINCCDQFLYQFFQPTNAYKIINDRRHYCQTYLYS